MIDFSKIPIPPEPTFEESAATFKPIWEAAAHCTIDAWPQAIMDLSVPTTLIEIDNATSPLIYEYGNPDAYALMDEYAAKIDAITGWKEHFIRLSTRSPKDVAPDERPITLSGKQAMWWISNSERCLDDITAAHFTNNRIYIAVRELYHAAQGGEFRCFAKDGKVIAISRYDFHKPARIEYDGAAITETIAPWYEKNIAEHYPTVVFDVDLGVHGRTDPLLIEVNPYGLSHPCLFNGYADIEQSGGFRA